MRIFLVPQVAKMMSKERLSTESLCRAAREVVAGTLGAGEANLGSGLYKKRIARPGRGKSGGYRMIIAFRPPRTDRVLFVYGFAKNAAATLTPQGQEALAKAAAGFLNATDRQVTALLVAGDVSEVDCNGHEQA